MTEFNKEHKKLLEELTGGIVFDDAKWKKMISSLNDLYERKIDVKQMKYLMWESRIEIIKHMVKMFPFFLESLKQDKDIEEFANNDGKVQSLKCEMGEKNELLEKCGIELQNIYFRLKNKLKT